MWLINRVDKFYIKIFHQMRLKPQSALIDDLRFKSPGDSDVPIRRTRFNNPRSL